MRRIDNGCDTVAAYSLTAFGAPSGAHSSSAMYRRSTVGGSLKHA